MVTSNRPVRGSCPRARPAASSSTTKARSPDIGRAPTTRALLMSHIVTARGAAPAVVWGCGSHLRRIFMECPGDLVLGPSGSITSNDRDYQRGEQNNDGLGIRRRRRWRLGADDVGDGDLLGLGVVAIVVIFRGTRARDPQGGPAASAARRQPQDLDERFARGEIKPTSTAPARTPSQRADRPSPTSQQEWGDFVSLELSRRTFLTGAAGTVTLRAWRRAATTPGAWWIPARRPSGAPSRPAAGPVRAWSPPG